MNQHHPLILSRMGVKAAEVTYRWFSAARRGTAADRRIVGTRTAPYHSPGRSWCGVRQGPGVCQSRWRTARHCSGSPEPPSTACNLVDGSRTPAHCDIVSVIKSGRVRLFSHDRAAACKEKDRSWMRSRSERNAFLRTFADGNHSGTGTRADFSSRPFLWHFNDLIQYDRRHGYESETRYKSPPVSYLWIRPFSSL